MMTKNLPFWGESPQPAKTYYQMKLLHDLFGIVDHSKKGTESNYVYVCDELTAGSYGGPVVPFRLRILSLLIFLIKKFPIKKFPFKKFPCSSSVRMRSTNQMNKVARGAQEGHVTIPR